MIMEQKGPSATGHGGRILIVEDEKSVRRILQRLVGGRYESITASCATDACTVLGIDGDFCAILCDLNMPGMSGIDLYRWLRGRDGDLAARMIFVTGGAFAPETARFLEDIANPVLEKPFEKYQLHHAIDRVTNLAKRGA